MKLRPYQIEALDAVKTQYNKGILRQLIVMPTVSALAPYLNNWKLVI